MAYPFSRSVCNKMDTTMIVLLLAAVVTVSIIIIVASQMRERARIERIRKTTALEDSYKRAGRLLSEIPGQYFTADLKLLLIKRMEESCKDLQALKSDQPVEERLSAVQQLKKSVMDGEDKRTPIKIDSPEKSTYVQELLQNLFKMIEGMHKAGKIDSATAKKNLKFVLFLVHKTHADLHVFQARVSSGQDRNGQVQGQPDGHESREKFPYPHQGTGSHQGGRRTQCRGRGPVKPGQGMGYVPPRR